MGVFKTGNAQSNEIIKASDIQFAFESVCENNALLAQMLLDSTQDFVIGGKVSAYGGLNISIAPIFGVCKDSGLMFGDTEAKLGVAVNRPETDSDRIDIVQIKGEWAEYDEQQRAFNDFDTDTQTFQNVFTKKKLTTVVEIKQGLAGSLKAPDTDDGYVKIAEISVKANATTLYDSDILNITSDMQGVENSQWSNEKDKTYNIGYISDVNKRFRTQHNEDGSHKENVITTKELDIGLSNLQVNGNTLPVGGEITIAGEQKDSSSSMYSVISKIVERVNSIYNEYQKFGAYAFNGEIKLSELIDENSMLSKAFSIGTSDLEENRYLYIKFNGKEILKLYDNGILRVLDSKNKNPDDLISKAVTDKLTEDMNALKEQMASVIEVTDTSVYTNKVLSRYTKDVINIIAATTKNIELVGLQIIDGVSVSAGDYILVKNQYNESENGIYEVSASSNWNRNSKYPNPQALRYKLFEVQKGTINKGKIFYIPTENFISSRYEDASILFVEHCSSVNPLSDKIAMRDNNGHLKSTSATTANDCVIKSDLLNMIYPIGSIYWSSKSTNPSELFGGTWKQIKDKFVLAAGDTYQALNSNNQENTGGNASISLETKNIPSHNHSYTPEGTISSHNHSIDKHSHTFSWEGNHTHTDNGHTHKYSLASNGGLFGGTGGYVSVMCPLDTKQVNATETTSGKADIQETKITISGTTSETTLTTDSKTPTFTGTKTNTESVGEGESFSIMPPYIVKYCFERIS